MFHLAVFDEWREWGSVPDSVQVAEYLENRFMQALADNLGPRGPATSTRIGEWSFMRCAQKVLLDDRYRHLRAPFVALVAPMHEELVEEAKRTLSEMLDGASTLRAESSTSPISDSGLAREKESCFANSRRRSRGAHFPYRRAASTHCNVAR
jgi:hypothetical protein